MKKRKFDGGGEIDDAEEAKYKALGTAASNAEKKSSGFLGLGRFLEGNIDQKGSVAYEKYGAGYGRRLEAEKAAKAPKVNTTPQAQAVAPVVKTAPAARPAMPSDEDTSFNSLESKRLASPRVSPGVTRVTEDMPTKRPEVGGQVTTGDARVAEYANAYPSSTTPEKADKGARDTSSYKKATSKGSGTAATPKAAIRTKNNDQAEDQTSYDSLEKRRFSSKSTGGGRSGGQGGPTRDDLETYTRKGFAANPMSTDPSQRRSAAASAPAKATASAPQTSAQAAQPVDETKLSLADRIKLSRERAKKGSSTDSRSVNQRFKDAFGMKKGGAVKGYASGGSVSSRADGIAQRGKTRGKIC
jgi:hypothetical protein